MSKKLEKEILKQVSRIEFEVRRIMSGVSLGVKNSAFKGQGMTFSDIRHYEPGDDIRNFAWKVMARTGVPHVKQFEEERDLEVHVAFDLGAGMNFGGLKKSKSMLQMYLLAFLGLSTCKSKDKFGGVAFGKRQIERFSALRGEDHVRRCLYSLLSLEKTQFNKKSDTSVALEYFLKLRSKNTLCLLISDFYSDIDRKLLAQVVRKHSLKLIHLHDPYEKEFPDIGWMEARSYNDLGSKSFLKSSTSRNRELNKTFEKKIKKLDQLSKSFGLHLIHQSTHDEKLSETMRSLQLRKAYG